MSDLSNHSPDLFKSSSMTSWSPHPSASTSAFDLLNSMEYVRLDQAGQPSKQSCLKEEDHPCKEDQPIDEEICLDQETSTEQSTSSDEDTDSDEGTSSDQGTGSDEETSNDQDSDSDEKTSSEKKAFDPFAPKWAFTHHYAHPADEYYEWHYDSDEEDLEEEIAELAEERKQHEANDHRHKPWPWSIHELVYPVELDDDVREEANSSESTEEEEIDDLADEDYIPSNGLIQTDNCDDSDEEAKQLDTVQSSSQNALQPWLRDFSILNKAVTLAAEALGEPEDQILRRRRRCLAGTSQNRRLFYAFWASCLEKAGCKNVLSWDDFVEVTKEETS